MKPILGKAAYYRLAESLAIEVEAGVKAYRQRINLGEKAAACGGGLDWPVIREKWPIFYQRRGGGAAAGALIIISATIVGAQLDEATRHKL